MVPKIDTKIRTKDGVRAFLAVFLVATVAVATMGLPLLYGGVTTTAEAAEPTADVESYDSISQAESSLGAADDIYLKDDGSAVLHYKDDSSDLNKFDLGVDVSEGLVHMLVVDDTDNQNAEYEEASFSAVLDQSGLSGDGSMIMQKPDDLKDLNAEVSGEVSSEANTFDASATGTFESQAATAGTVSTNGHVTATPDRLETSGSVSVEGGMGAAASGTYMDVSLEDTNSGYTLDMTQEQLVSEWSASQWETREKAKQTLQQQYASVATGLGGSSEVTISNYNFVEQSNGQYKLTLEFTVEYSGIDNGIEQQLASQLASDPSTDLSRSEATEIASTVTDLEIETLEFTLDGSGGSMDADWTIAIANYDELSLAMIDMIEASSASGEIPQEDIESARTAIEAQQAADLTWKLEWDGSIEQTSNQEMKLDASISSNTENWGAYIDKLESEGVEPPKDVTFEMSAKTDGDELALDAQFDLEAKDLATQAVNAWAKSVQSSSTTMSSDADQFVQALAESELEVARVDANLGDGTVRIEGGARFKDMSKLTDTVSNSMSISGVASETNDGSASVYVYVDDMGDVDTASATKSDIEHLDVVGSKTTVHAAGEWDEEFPPVKTDEMQNYLKTDSNDGDDKDDKNGGDSIPGFGMGVGLAAIAGLLTTFVLRLRE
ncbi:hypothetical protein [Natrinema halophilum]|uniref:PGF-CTERM sorting domain-containing protein n=1 Tax=Natrinema halophilum TaxID=1699371 RepID=A0A7D5KKZ1_9EURY|nr:hypothetical protein [Natrinema halophilum]QLG50959.1 hypothetical protein HYG82_20025 [Natrinema halophilum]